MNYNHQLEWVYNPDFSWGKCKKVSLHKGYIDYETLHKHCGERFEIQRVIVDMDGGYHKVIQSPTKNIINISSRYVTISGSVKRCADGVYEFQSFKFRREFVRKISVYVSYPPQIRINKVKEGEDDHPTTEMLSDGYIQHFDND